MTKVTLPAAPADTTLAFLRSAWCDVLDLVEIADDDNFLDLGGDSIAAALCLNRIRSACNVEIGIEALLVDTLTLREVAALIDQHQHMAAAASTGA